MHVHMYMYISVSRMVLSGKHGGHGFVCRSRQVAVGRVLVDPCLIAVYLNVCVCVCVCCRLLVHSEQMHVCCNA